MYKLGIDVGGTNTDAVLVDENKKVIASTKSPTTREIYDGILESIQEVLKLSQIAPSEIRQAMLGTTQCTNAIVEGKKLAPVALIRIGAPAMQGITPMVDWPTELQGVVTYQTSVGGGYEYDGKEIAKLDEEKIVGFLKKVGKNVNSVAISCVFSPVRSEHEQRCAELVQEVLGQEVHISKSSEIGTLSFIERENATILNAALYEVANSFTDGFEKSLREQGIKECEIYLSQNDGTLMTMEEAKKYPILTIACGPTNSIRGAAYLSKIQDGIVVDVGGTTTDIGVIQNGFPRESSVAVTIGGVRTNFRMPDVISMGLGGGSIVREVNQVITVGPDSVGYELLTKAKIFGGSVLTATDIAVRLGMVKIGNPALVEEIELSFAQKAMAVMHNMIAESIDKMKLSSQDIDAIFVGGGAVIIPEKIEGVARVLKPEHFVVANAIGAAISKVSGTYEQLVSFDEVPREEALLKAKEEAVRMAVEAGALEDTVQIIEVEDVPLAYYPGNTSRVKVKAAGDLV